MTTYIDLTKLFIRSLRINKANHKKGKVAFNILLLFTILFVFIPFLLIYIAFVYGMMGRLDEVGYASIGLEALLSIISIFAFVFSFNVLLNELYFSDDIDNLLPLPIKPETLVLSKFSSCFVIENIILFIFLFFACLSYKFATGIPTINLILSLPGIILLPLAPMLYGTYILMMIIFLLKKYLNKKTMKRIGIFFLIMLVFGIFLLLWNLSKFDFEQYLENFAMGDHKFLNAMRIVFPSVFFFVKGFHESSLLSILISYLINGALVGLLVLLSKYFYYDGVISLLNKDTTPLKSSIKKLNKNKEKSQIMSYLIKEVKLLFYSPTFFINCLLINVIWPIFVLIIAKVGLPNYTIQSMRDLLMQNNKEIYIILLLYSLGIAIMVTAFNSIASSSFSREGRNYHFIKYIPMKYGIQWRIKWLVSLLITFIGIHIFVIPFYITIHLNIGWVILFIFLSILCISLISLIGIAVDSSSPKIIWEDENDAMRENYNAFISMGFSLLVFGIVCGGGYYLNHNYTVPYSLILLFSTILLVLGNFALYWYCHKKISYQIINQENV